jgi:hypothetical protein
VLWAITSYFNPCGYKARLANYRLFRSYLNVPLVTVEAALDGRFELGPGDAEILVQRPARDVLWQKERLLNIALEFLPGDCRDVAWMDCDVVFAGEDWAERASQALERYSLVHLFSEGRRLERAASTDPPAWDRVERVAEGVGKKLAANEAAPEDLFESDAQLRLGPIVGFAWAARRAVLDEHGLYDACILGTGDRAILCAALGELAHAVRAAHMNARQVEHYRRWAAPFFPTMGGRVGCIEGRIFHLWHGDAKDRKYSERNRLLRQFDFDPFTDIAIDREGCWQWGTAKPAMHEYVRRYFASRNEDGALARV